MSELKTADVNGLTIGYREEGPAQVAGPAIIFMHGIGSGSRAWQPQLDHFGASWRAIAWDAPGYGGSGDLTNDDPPATDFGDALVGLMDALGIETAHLVGNSLGALMISAVVGKHSGRVASIFLSDAAAGHGRKSAEEQEKMIAGRLEPLAELGPAGLAEQRARNLIGSVATEEVFEAVKSVMAEIRPEGYARAARMLAHGDIFAGLEGCAAPGMVVCGSEDTVTPPSSNREIAAFIDAAYVEIEGAGHLPYAETPARFNELLEGFLASQQQAAAE